MEWCKLKYGIYFLGFLALVYVFLYGFNENEIARYNAPWSLNNSIWIPGGHPNYIPEVVKVKQEYQSTLFKNNYTIAIGGAICSKAISKWTKENIPNKFVFFTILLPSFCRTASSGYNYQFYLAYDHDDPFFNDNKLRNAFQIHFLNISARLCAPKNLKPGIHMYRSFSNRAPALSQHDGMINAYLDGVTFLFRTTDDSSLITSNWTEDFIKTLASHKPPNVGITGPNHKGGNLRVMTMEFCHRTHIDIFGLWYPSQLPWWADQWLTKVYEPKHATKVMHVRLDHTQKQGRRYKVVHYNEKETSDQLAKYKPILRRYLKYRDSPPVKPDGKKVIAMSLYNNDLRYTWGAVRNAQIIPVYYPGWKLRVYIPHPTEASNVNETKINKSRHDETSEVLADVSVIPGRIIATLQRLGADVFYVKTREHQLPPNMWSSLVALDENVEYFLIRDVEARLSDREADAVKQWIKSGAVFHCMRDHPDHKKTPIVPGTWGAKRAHFMKILNNEVFSKLSNMTNLWHDVENNAFCHDSVSCDKWNNSHPFPSLRNGVEYIGQKYNDRNQFANQNYKKLNSFERPKACADNNK